MCSVWRKRAPTRCSSLCTAARKPTRLQSSCKRRPCATMTWPSLCPAPPLAEKFCRYCFLFLPDGSAAWCRCLCLLLMPAVAVAAYVVAVAAPAATAAVACCCCFVCCCFLLLSVCSQQSECTVLLRLALSPKRWWVIMPKISPTLGLAGSALCSFSLHGQGAVSVCMCGSCHGYTSFAGNRDQDAVLFAMHLVS